MAAILHSPNNALPFSSQLNLTHITQRPTRRRVLPSAACCVPLQSLRATRTTTTSRFTGLRKEPSELASELFTKRRSRGSWWQFADGCVSSKGLGLKAVMAAASFGMPADRGDMGLYDPSFDKDSCGVGFVAELSAQPNRKIVSISTFRFLLCKTKLREFDTIDRSSENYVAGNWTCEWHRSHTQEADIKYAYMLS